VLLMFCCAFASPSSGQASAASAIAAPIQEESPINVPQKPTEPVLLNNYVESGVNYIPLTDNFGHWAGGYIRSSVTKGRNVWNAEITGQSEFGDSGVYFGGGDTFTLNQDWYASVSAGSSAGGFFWPRFRTDEFINKKWLKRKQWITTLGFGYDAAKDAHRDRSFYIGTTYYFQRPWIAESGIRFNISNPGSVFSPAGFVAITEGRNNHHYVTVRVGAGEEAYQLIDPTLTLSDFQSQTVTVTLRQWIGQHWGINFVGDYYHNPFYSRGGPSIGFFKDF
jgi:YaiO family outer membrane protein